MTGMLPHTVEKDSTIKRKVYVVCEGETEREYFNYFFKYHSGAGSFEPVKDVWGDENDQIKNKWGVERDQTDRKRLVDMAEGDVKFYRDGKDTPYHYVTYILQYQLPQMSHSNEKKLKNGANEIIEKAVSEIENNPQLLDEKGYVADENQAYEVVQRRILEFYNKENIDEIIHKPDPKHSHRQKKPWHKNDRVFVVFDRDLDCKHPELRTDDDYRKIARDCEKLKDDGLDFRILLSTPFFEFWLLLHHQGDEWKNFIKDTSSLNSNYFKNNILKALRKKEKNCKDWKDKNGQQTDYHKVKGITPERYYTYYKNGFETALEKTEQLGYSFEELLQHAGSNVGVELDALLRDDDSTNKRRKRRHSALRVSSADWMHLVSTE